MIKREWGIQEAMNCHCHHSIYKVDQISYQKRRKEGEQQGEGGEEPFLTMIWFFGIIFQPGMHNHFFCHNFKILKKLKLVLKMGHIFEHPKVSCGTSKALISSRKTQLLHNQTPI